MLKKELYHMLNSFKSRIIIKIWKIAKYQFCINEVVLIYTSGSFSNFQSGIDYLQNYQDLPTIFVIIAKQNVIIAID